MSCLQTSMPSISSTRNLFACALTLALAALSFEALAKKSSSIAIAWEAAPRSIDPRYASDANSQYLSGLTHCSLITFDKNGSAVGELAKEWKWLDPKTLLVTIHDNVKFSDGKPLSASDVKATYDFFKKDGLKNPSPLAGAFKTIKSIETPKPNQLKFTLQDPDSSFATNLMIGILPSTIASQELLAKPVDLVGCGAFKLISSNNSSLTLLKNPLYSLPAPAKIDEIEIKIVKDELTRFAKLQKGELDIVQNIIGRDKVEQISRKFPNLKVAKRPGLNVTYLGFNFKDKALANPQLRKAIGMAIDRSIIIKYILKDMAVPASAMLIPSDPYLNKEITALPYDPEQAKKLLDKAGFKQNGENPRLHLTYKTTTDLTRISIAKAIASLLKKVGIKVDVQSLEWGKFKADVEKGQVQLWSLSWVGFKDPDIYRFAFATENFPPVGGNRGWYSNPNLDEILKKARITTDQGERKKLYDQAQKIVAEELPYIFLWHEENFAVMNKNLKGFELFADGRLSSLVTATK